MLGDTPNKVLNRMNNVMVHRGPDMGEIYLDDEIGLCHRRLSIIDLSEDGRQPMHTVDGRYTIVFNGEIYNFRDLRKELSQKGFSFQSQTDTEILLLLYTEYGPSSLEKIRGMYAYAIWDNEEKSLFAARDRIGKKPLYYHQDGKKFAFASEIKSLLELETISREIDSTSLIDYLKYLFIPHPKSIYKKIAKLPPGHYLLFENGRLTIREYWDVSFAEPLTKISEQTIQEELLTVVREAVHCRMISDVPLGSFLSGGIDSSAVVKLMSEKNDSPVTTCTIGFDDEKSNEAVFAKEFANALHANHHEYYIQDEPAQIIKKLVWHFDEPFADSSMVPTYYVSQMARKNVTVVLSGDGGDESFAGYQKYVVDRIENLIRQWTPSFLLAGIGGIAGVFSCFSAMRRANALCTSARMDPVQGFYVTNTFISDHHLKKLLTPQVYNSIKEYDPSQHLTHYYNASDGPDHLSKILYTDLKLYLPGDILVKVDRMSMANSLEVRSPLLDHKVIELAARIPANLKLRNGEKKYILKNSFAKILPHEVLYRKKHGFDAPINNWFRNELKEMAETAFFKTERVAEYFQIPFLKELWSQHQTGRAQNGTLLWTLFVFILWLEMIST